MQLQINQEICEAIWDKIELAIRVYEDDDTTKSKQWVRELQKPSFDQFLSEHNIEVRSFVFPLVSLLCNHFKYEFKEAFHIVLIALQYAINV